MNAVDEGKLSNHIYCLADFIQCNPDNGPVPGFKDVSNDSSVLTQLGLKYNDLSPPDTDFRAAVFQRQEPPFKLPEEAGYVVIFKGTSPGSVEDWQNNFRQGMDADSPYYKRAVIIGKRVAAAVGDPANPRVSFAGHSLGGGLASAAAQASGLPANTFNAAGLHPATMARYHVSARDTDTYAYHVPGDPLTEANVQGVKIPVIGIKVSPPLAAGKPEEVPRAAQDDSIPPGESDTYFHTMPVVTRAIERRKSADAERLLAAVPKKKKSTRP